MKIKCNCTHTYQDKLHGKGNRVHNKTQKTMGVKTLYRCTVCKVERTT